MSKLKNSNKNVLNNIEKQVLSGGAVNKDSQENTRISKSLKDKIAEIAHARGTSIGIEHNKILQEYFDKNPDIINQCKQERLDKLKEELKNS